MQNITGPFFRSLSLSLSLSLSVSPAVKWAPVSNRGSVKQRSERDGLPLAYAALKEITSQTD